MRRVRVRLALQLTKDEVGRLESRAAGEARSVSNLIEWIIASELAPGKRRARKPRDSDPKRKRRAYDVAPFLTIPERRELEKRAEAERRSLSGYVTRLVLAAID